MGQRSQPTGLASLGPAGVRGCGYPSRIAAFVYLLRCADGTLYCGWSTDPERRLRQHQAGTASRYTRRRLPVELVYTREFETRSEAMREEVRIKQLPAAEKRRIANV
jgi:putative endonuclease